MKTLKVLSLLLAYPTPELMVAGAELKEVLRSERVLKGAPLEGVLDLIDDLAAHDIYDAQERYVLLFDRTRSLSLHLFEHVHGESRDRGQAMVDLLRLYEEAGFRPTAKELPDYLPMFLEFASTRPAAEALELIGQPAHVLGALKERLARRKSPYVAVLAALVAITRVKLDPAHIAALNAEPDPEPDDLEALDAAWHDEEVKFGPSAGGDCGVDSLAAKVRQARRPASGSAPPTARSHHPVVTTSVSRRT